MFASLQVRKVFRFVLLEYSDKLKICDGIFKSTEVQNVASPKCLLSISSKQPKYDIG